MLSVCLDARNLFDYEVKRNTRVSIKRVHCAFTISWCRYFQRRAALINCTNEVSGRKMRGETEASSDCVADHGDGWWEMGGWAHNQMDCIHFRLFVHFTFHVQKPVNMLCFSTACEGTASTWKQNETANQQQTYFTNCTATNTLYGRSKMDLSHIDLESNETKTRKKKIQAHATLKRVREKGRARIEWEYFVDICGHRWNVWQ